MIIRVALFKYDNDKSSKSKYKTIKSVLMRKSEV